MAQGQTLQQFFTSQGNTAAANKVTASTAPKKISSTGKVVSTAVTPVTPKVVSAPAVTTKATPAPVVTTAPPVAPVSSLQSAYQSTLDKYKKVGGGDVIFARKLSKGQVAGVTAPEGKTYQDFIKQYGQEKYAAPEYIKYVQAQAETGSGVAEQTQPIDQGLTQDTDTSGKSSVMTPTAEELASWALKGGKTNLQNNTYWSSQPDDIKKKAWEIMQGQQGTATGTDSTGQSTDTSGTDEIFPSDQQNQVQSYQDLLNLGNDRWDTFLDNQVSAFQKLQDDFASLMETQINNVTMDSQAIMDQLDKMQQSYETERQASIARIEQSADYMGTIAAQQKDNALKANQLAAKQSNNEYGLQMDMMRDNNSRYMGYLQGKFEAAGMSDSSAGMQLLGKFLTAADLNMAYVLDAKINTQQEFLNTGNEIMTSYFDQAYEIEMGKNDQIAQVNSDMYDRIDKIQLDKLSTSTKKNEMILEAMKEGTAMQADIQSKISQEVQAVSQAKLQEAEYKFNVLKAIDEEERYWAEFAEAQRQSAINEEQWNASYNLEYAKYENDKKIAGDKAYLDYIGATSDLNLDPAIKEQILRIYDPSLIPSAYEYVDPNTGESMNLEERILNTLDKVSSGVPLDELQQIFQSSTPEGAKGSIAQFAYEALGANYQCVQFVRDIMPDLPTGLGDINDKINILVNSVNGKPAGSIPEIGDVMVLSWSAEGTNSGHVALVTAIDLENGKVEISQFNKPPNQFSKQWVSITDQDVKGYWRSDNLKNVSGNVFTSTEGGLTTQQLSSKEMQWRSQLNNNIVLKSYYKTRESTGKMEVAYAAYEADPTNPGAAEGVQVAFEKIFDPDSVVMPSEAQRTAEMQDAISKGQGLFKQWSGQSASKLTPEAIQQMYTLSQEISSGMNKYAANTLYPLYNDSVKYGIDINRVIDPDMQDIFFSIYTTGTELTEEEEVSYSSWE